MAKNKGRKNVKRMADGGDPGDDTPAYRAGQATAGAVGDVGHAIANAGGEEIARRVNQFNVATQPAIQFGRGVYNAFTGGASNTPAASAPTPAPAVQQAGPPAYPGGAAFRLSQEGTAPPPGAVPRTPGAVAPYGDSNTTMSTISQPYVAGVNRGLGPNEGAIPGTGGDNSGGYGGPDVFIMPNEMYGNMPAALYKNSGNNFASSRLRAEMARTGMEQFGAGAREQMSQQGATQRTGMSEAGATQRAGMGITAEAPLRGAQAGYYGQEAALTAPKAQQEQMHANAFAGYQKALSNAKTPAQRDQINQGWQEYMKNTSPYAATQQAEAAQTRAGAAGLTAEQQAATLGVPVESLQQYQPIVQGHAKGGIVRGFAAGGDVPGNGMMPSGGALQPGVAATAASVHPAIAQYGQYLTAAAQARVPPVPFSQYINLLASTHSAMQGQPTQFPGGMSSGIAPNGMAGGGPVMAGAAGDYDYPGGMWRGGGVGVGGGNAGDGSTGVYGQPYAMADGGNVSALQRPLHGPGTGTSDSIPAVIDGSKPAALSKGEFVIPAHVVHRLGVKFFEDLLEKNHPTAVAREKREKAYAAR